MKTRGSAAGDRLVHTLRAILAAVGDVTVEAQAPETRRWASITFTGERHRLRLRIAGPNAGEAAERLEAGLTDLEPNLPGQLLVDMALAARETESDGSVRIVLDAVTVEEA